MQATPSLFKFSKGVKMTVLFLAACCFYCNTITNEYALDDEAVIQKNAYVQMGFRGIGKILTTDAYQNYYKINNSNQMLPGGRFRPLSMVLFAIEHQLWGESPYMRHAVNVILYALCILTIFYFLHTILPNRLPFGEDIAFISALLFAMHPVHTEVVANIKSSDELLSLMFILTTLTLSIRYRETKEAGKLALGLFTLFLALLSKEYALTLLFLLPLLFNLYFKEGIGKSVLACLPWFGVIAFYLAVRFASIGFPHHYTAPDVLNAPYLYATPAQQAASEISVLGKYLVMLIFPYPLAYDYGFAQLPYQNFSSPAVWINAAAYSAIVCSAIILWRKRNILAFPVFFFLLNLFMVSNFVMNIGATMGERLIFHSSLGFATMLSAAIVYAAQRISGKRMRPVIMSILIVIAVPSLAETCSRNRVWKNNFTLFTNDVHIVPNSVKANDNAGAQWINLCETVKDTAKSDSLARVGIQYLTKAITIDSVDVTGYMNLGVAYCKLIQPDSAKYYWDKAVRLFPGWMERRSNYSTLSRIFLFAGNRYGARGDYRKSIFEMRQGLICDSGYADLWFFLGGTYYNLGKYDSAQYAWLKVQQIDAGYTGLKGWLEAVALKKTANLK